MDNINRSVRSKEVEEFQSRLKEISIKLSEIRLEKLKLLQDNTEMLTKSIVDNAMSKVQETLERYVSLRNKRLQTLLTSIDNHLTETKGLVEELHYGRDSALKAASTLAENKVEVEQYGRLMVQDKDAQNVMEGFHSTTQSLINDVSVLRVRPEEMLQFVNEKISSMANSYVVALEQRMRSNISEREKKQQEMVSTAQKEIQEISAMIHKMTSLQGHLGAWLTNGMT